MNLVSSDQVVAKEDLEILLPKGVPGSGIEGRDWLKAIGIKKVMSQDEFLLGAASEA